MYKLRIEIFPHKYLNVEYSVINEFRGLCKIHRAIVSGGTIDMYPLLDKKQQRSVLLKIKANHRNKIELINN